MLKPPFSAAFPVQDSRTVGKGAQGFWPHMTAPVSSSARELKPGTATAQDKSRPHEHKSSFRALARSGAYSMAVLTAVIKPSRLLQALLCPLRKAGPLQVAYDESSALPGRMLGQNSREPFVNSWTSTYETDAG
jgi:hypothetical protein